MSQEKEFAGCQWIANQIRLIKSLILFHCYGPPCISFSFDLQYSNLSAKKFGINPSVSRIIVMITPCVIFLGLDKVYIYVFLVLLQFFAK